MTRGRWLLIARIIAGLVAAYFLTVVVEIGRLTPCTETWLAISITIFAWTLKERNWRNM